MDEARSILKDCGELMTQATNTLPRSLKLAGVGGAPSENGGVANGDGAETDGDGKGTVDAPSDSNGSKVRLRPYTIIS